MDRLMQLSEQISDATAKAVGLEHFSYIPDNEASFEKHWMVLAIIGASYCPVIYLLGKFMENRQPYGLKAPLAIWNALLGLFSIIGALVMFPLWLQHLKENDYSFHDTLCSTEVFKKKGAYMVFLFNLSKAPEFIDTVFLRLRKKPVIFLHWYHHIATFLYCWIVGSSSHHYNGAGLVFGAMNVIVHSFMYPYYFLQAVNMGKPLQRWGINALLTSLQLTQMVLGTYMTLHVQYKCPEAHKYPQGYYYATLVMYASYLVLFAKLFVDKYITPKPKKGKAD